VSVKAGEVHREARRVVAHPPGRAQEGIAPMQKQRIPREPRSAAHGTLGRTVRELRARFGHSQESLAFESGLHAAACRSHSRN
jgi:hypothetical protein